MSPPYAAASIESKVAIPLMDGTITGTFIAFAGLSDTAEHFAIQFGTPGPRPLVRVHSECVTGDLFGSRRCDCGPQLRDALAALSGEGGYLVYLRQEGRGIGLRQKLRAYGLQDAGIDTFEANRRLGYPADGRSFAAAAEMLAALGIAAVTLMTNNPAKTTQLRSAGIDVQERPAGTHRTAENASYLAAKRDLSGHSLDLG